MYGGCACMIGCLGHLLSTLFLQARSPVFSHLSATLTGLTTVRAFKAQRRFTDDFDRYQDNHTKAWFLVLATARWFGVQLDIFNVLFITGVCFACVIAADGELIPCVTEVPQPEQYAQPEK